MTASRRRLEMRGDGDGDGDGDLGDGQALECCAASQA